MFKISWYAQVFMDFMQILSVMVDTYAYERL
jgi:hypothetical protein